MVFNSPYSKTNIVLRILIVLALVCAFAWLSACGSAGKKTPPVGGKTSSTTYLAAVGYTVQVGAFRQESNAVNFAKKLKQAGVDAYHFVDNDGFYKVRFGSFNARDKAVAQAKALHNKGLIEEYWVTMPKAEVNTPAQKTAMRESLIQTAYRFEGVPYKWGGTSAATGFDCSGYTMTVYRLNGLQMPRTAREQFAKGYSVKKSQLKKGDLVFFDTMKKGYASHVGIYLGNGKFIHAPRTGKSIEEANFNSDYFQKCYLGARAYF